MKKGKDPRVYLAQILECARKIANYTAKGKQHFFTEAVTQDAVIRNFEIIGEAAKQVPDEYRQAHPEISWRGLAAFRDVLIHQYERIDLPEVWRVIESELQPLQQAIERLLPPLEQLEAELAGDDDVPQH